MAEYIAHAHPRRGLRRNWLSPRPLVRIAASLAVIGGTLVSVASPARAGDAVLVAANTTAPNIVGDSNVEAQPDQGPDAFTISVEFCNTGATSPVDDLIAYVGDGTTPGAFPDTVVPPGGAYEGTFDLDLVMGLGNDAIRPIGSLAPGACRSEFWIVSYDVVDANGDAVWGASNNPDDDLVLGFSYWAEGVDRNGTSSVGDDTPVTVSGSAVVTVRNEISANSNKIRPAGATTTVTPGRTVPVGHTVSVTFSGVNFGNVGQGFDGDGDGSFDFDLWFQPIGEAALWDPDFFRLVGLTATLEGTGCGGRKPDVTLNLIDTYYVKGLDVYGNCKWGGSYTYRFVALSPGTATIAPYQEVASGSDNEKYNGDYCGTDPASAPDICVVLTSVTDLTFAKEVDRAVAAVGDQLNYTMTVANTGATPVGDPSGGYPIRIIDAVPPQATFVAGSAGCDVACVLEYSVDGGRSFGATEPADAATITHLRAELSDPLAGGATAGVGFRAAIKPAATGTVINEAEVSIGDGAAFLFDDATTTVAGPGPSVSVSKVASVGSVAEPGGTVTFTVEATNTSVEAVTVSGLVDDVFGDLLDAGNLLVAGNSCPGQSKVLAAGGVFACSFDADLVGNAGDPDHVNTVTVTVTDDDANTATATDTATVTYISLAGASVSGTLGLDLTGDGLVSANEPLLSGVLVELVDAGGAVIAAVTTDVDGFYEFVDLAPGSYTVAVDLTTVPDGLAIVGDPDETIDGVTPAELEPGEHLGDRDFVFRGTGRIGDYVWLDDDGDGIQDSDEDPLPGVGVTLTWSGFSSGQRSLYRWTFPAQLTGSDGRYLFEHLPPGSYRVAAESPAGLSPTTQTVVTVELGVGDVFMDGDMGFVARADEPLPQTGFDSGDLVDLGLTLVVLAVELLLIAALLERRRRLA